MAKKNMSKGTNVALQTAVSLELVTCDLDEVGTDFENVRSGDVTDDGGEDGSEDQTFEGLMSSIQAKGQKTPCIFRPAPNAKGKIKYQLIAGFRRYAALCKLQETTGVKYQIIGIVKPLDDLGAVIENMTENQRRKLRPADLMMGLWRVKVLSEAKGDNLNGTQVGAIVGCNKTHAYDLMGIVEKAPKVAKMWFDAQYQLGVREMRTIAKIEGEGAQVEAYNAKLAALTPDPNGEGEGDGPDPDKWIERCVVQAERIATVLGHLERRGAWRKLTLNWEEELEWLGVKVKAGAKKAQRNKIAKKADKAYQAALVWVEPVEEEESTEAA